MLLGIDVACAELALANICLTPFNMHEFDLIIWDP